MNSSGEAFLSVIDVAQTGIAPLLLDLANNCAPHD
jgi:hypothetical protein